MTFTSEEMMAAAKESIDLNASAEQLMKDIGSPDACPYSSEEKSTFKEGFYHGALWGASKVEESRQCEIIEDGHMGFNDHECENCRAGVLKDHVYCWHCGYKFIKGGVGMNSLIAIINRQKKWSEKTFGPGDRTDGLIDHIKKELKEILKANDDLEEWIDVIILALDGAWRSGHSAEEIVDCLNYKQTKNQKRSWPNWRTAEPGKAIEHVRDGE